MIILTIVRDASTALGTSDDAELTLADSAHPGVLPGPSRRVNRYDCVNAMTDAAWFSDVIFRSTLDNLRPVWAGWADAPLSQHGELTDWHGVSDTDWPADATLSV
jgi:hypothetical protein